MIVRVTEAAICVFVVVWIAVILSGSNAASENGANYLSLTNIVTSVCPWGFGDKGQPGVSGPLEILNTNAAPIVSGDDDTSPTRAIIGAASQSGNGRVVGLGHDGFFINGALNLYDNKQFGLNIIDWLEGTQDKKKILVTTGHGEPWVGSGDYDDFYAELRNKGYAVELFSGTVTSSSLSDVSILFISCPGPSLTDAEIDTIRSFVSNGGGLLIQGLGWAWVSYEKKSLDEYPVNKLAMPCGFKWIGGYISDPTNNRKGCPVFHTFFHQAGNIINKIDTPENSKSNQSEGTTSSDRGSTSSSNLPPAVESLTPSAASPQDVGATVTWTATASDPDNDPLYYKFLLSGPSTGEKWTTMQDWSSKNTWNWNVRDSDIGSSDVSVLIRDGKHADASNMDDFKNISGYKIISKQLSNIDVQVMNGLYTDRDRNVYYCQESKYLYFRNRLYLTGPDLDKVAKVKYILPQSFPNPEQISQDTSNNFEIWILTWGKFNGIALVTTKSGQQFQIQYNIAFKDKVEAAKSQGIPMVQNCEG